LAVKMAAPPTANAISRRRCDEWSVNANYRLLAATSDLVFGLHQLENPQSGAGGLFKETSQCQTRV
jgi:hypothetical protein